METKMEGRSGIAKLARMCASACPEWGRMSRGCCKDCRYLDASSGRDGQGRMYCTRGHWVLPNDSCGYWE